MDSVQRRQTTSQIYDCAAVTPSDTRLITRSNAMHQNWRYGPVRYYPFVLIVKSIAVCKDVQSLLTWISRRKHPPSCATDVIWSQIRDIGNCEVLFFCFLSFSFFGWRGKEELLSNWLLNPVNHQNPQQQNSNLTINSNLPTFGLPLFKPAIRDVGLAAAGGVRMLLQRFTTDFFFTFLFCFFFS